MRYTKKLWIPVTLLLCLGLAVWVSESQGWPFLIAPLQSLLAQKLGRTVLLQPISATAQARLHLWGGVMLESPLLYVAAPSWSKTPYMLQAHDVRVQLRYGDIWQALHGQQWVIASLKSGRLDANLERLADGRASWQLVASGNTAPAPRLEIMEVNDGAVHYDDAALALSLKGSVKLSSIVAGIAPALAAAAHTRNLQITASGHYRKAPFRLSLATSGALPWEADTEVGLPVAVKLQVQSDRAHLSFVGSAHDVMHLNGLAGNFTLDGPSLAAVGAPLGVTLPTTKAFRAVGALKRSGKVWDLSMRELQVGASRLSGLFNFDTSAAVPRLSGTLEGAVLNLVDLAPAVGVVSAPTSATAPKVLPKHIFDLAALRAMNADVQIKLRRVDTNTRWLEPLSPFNAHLLLVGGVLTLKEIDARTAQGHLVGALSLDGQGDIANWRTDLKWDGVQLAQWIHQPRRANARPYLSGQLQGQAKLVGRGRSTAEILSTLQGNLVSTIANGSISHLLIELMGLDLAQSLGVYLKGDEPLPLGCAVAVLAVGKGVIHPQTLAIDTSDSTAWVTGSLSLATEKLDLRLVVAPKDFSPLTLRTPLRVSGTFAHPDIGLEKRALALKLGTTLLLGMLNPVAAFIPLVDLGDRSAANQHAASCRTSLQQRLQKAATQKATAQ